MKLNCDMGEGFGRYGFGVDGMIMPHIHMANIACGFHAGDPAIMRQTVRMAMEYGVEVGAHPAYPDLQGFGRRNMDISPDDIRQIILYQAGALSAFCRAEGGRLAYIKPHGALYNTMMAKEDILLAVIEGVAEYNSGGEAEVRLMIQATANWQHQQDIAARRGVRLYLEAFADRSYEEDGSLRSRKYVDALLDRPAVLERVRLLLRHGIIRAVTGKELRFPVDSLCVHGDSDAGVSQIATLRALIESDGEKRGD